ncbi:MAG: SMI1/KNR4 family protein [Janthinobacterium lividum]
MPPSFQEHFPKFARFLASGRADLSDEMCPPALTQDIEAEEKQLGIPLPLSYKTFLMVARGVFLQGGGFQMGPEHPFFHTFPPQEELTAFQ